MDGTLTQLLARLYQMDQALFAAEQREKDTTAELAGLRDRVATLEAELASGLVSRMPAQGMDLANPQ